MREVSLSPVTEWIEKKLAIEFQVEALVSRHFKWLLTRILFLFQRVFVMPNMDDVKIPLMLDHLA